MKTFSPKISRISIAYNIFAAIFGYFIFRSATEEAAWSILFVVLLMFPGALIAGLVAASQIIVDAGGNVSLRQLGRNSDLGNVADLEVLSPRPRLPFGTGVPRLARRGGRPVRALPLTKAVFVQPDSGIEFLELLKRTRSA